MSSFDDGSELEFFEEPETIESPDRPRRRIRPRPGGPRRPAPPPPGAVALARLAGLVALAIAVVVGLVFWVGSCQGKSKHDEYQSYMDSVRSIAASSAASGTELTTVLGSANLTLPGLQTKLGQWSQQQQQNYDDALSLRPPGPLQSANQQVLSTLQLRAIGFTNLADTIAGAGAKPASEVASLLAQQAELLAASDLVWTDLFKLPAQETLRRLGVRGVIPPPSRIVTTPDVITARSFEIVYSRLKAANTGGKGVTGLHGSTLLGTQAVTGGKATPLTTSGATTVNVAADLTFKVSLKNAGNFQEVKVPVTLTVSVFAKQVLQKTEQVASILKGQTQTVSFGNLNLPTSAFSANAIVHVEVGKVPGETNLTDNKASYPVFFSLPSGG